MTRLHPITEVAVLLALLACAPAGGDTSAAPGAPGIVTTVHDYDCGADGAPATWGDAGAPVQVGAPVNVLQWVRYDGDGESVWELAGVPDLVPGEPVAVTCRGESGGHVVYACTGC